jgi:hypothetical protein
MGEKVANVSSRKEDKKWLEKNSLLLFELQALKNPLIIKGFYSF